MTPEELLTISMYDEVDIESNTILPPIDMLSFSFKGYQPLQIAKIPLYIALHLRSMNSCVIRTPLYLEKDFIENVVEREKKEEGFVELPEYLFEHAYIFEVESSLSELKQLRLLKILKGLNSLDGKALCINGLTKWEFNEIRESITEAMRIGKVISSEKFGMEG